MEEREIAEGVEKQPYFEAVTVTQESEQDDGTREMGELYPFLISGGTNTERYYFTHINDLYRGFSQKNKRSIEHQ